MIRVEEELKHQRELMQQGFAMMDKRFEEMQQQIDKRFDAVDKRFEEMQQQMDKRFEEMQQQMDKRFEEITSRLDRFMVWSFSTTVTVGGLVVALLKLWN